MTPLFFFLWPSQIKSVLENYLYVNCEFNSNQVSVHMLSEMDVGDTQLNNVMKQKIADGYPVIYCGGRFMEEEYPVGSIITDSVGAHALIAYDVIGEGESEDILLHTGWTGGEYISVKTTAYKHFNYIIWIEINENALTHNHSNKYIDSEVPTKTYCACEIYSTHPAHNNNHIFENSCDSENHYQKCHCGAKINIEDHNIVYSYYTPLQHNKRCSECLYLTQENHTYNILHSTSDTSHTYKCVCGVSSTSDHNCTPTSVGSSEYHELLCSCGYVSREEAHMVSRYDGLNSSYHYSVCACGYIIDQSTHDWQKTGLMYTCRQCGYKTSALDGPILWKIEEDEEEL